MTVQIQVVRVVVVPRHGRTEGPRQVGPAALDARDPLPIEVGHQLRAAQVPLGGPVSRDDDRKGHNRRRHEQRGRLAASLGDQEPGAGPGGHEDHQPEPLERPDHAGPPGRLSIEAAGAVRVSGGGLFDRLRAG